MLLHAHGERNACVGRLAVTAHLRQLLVRQADNVLLGTFNRVQNFRRRRFRVKIFPRSFRNGRNFFDVLFRRENLQRKNRIRRGGHACDFAGVLVSVARRHNRHDAFVRVFGDADKFLFRLPLKQTETVSVGVRGVGRRRADERPDRIFFAGFDNFDFPAVAGRLETFGETFPRKKSVDVRGNCRRVVSADDFLARLGVRRKFFGRAQLFAGDGFRISENGRVVLLRADFGYWIFPVVGASDSRRREKIFSPRRIVYRGRTPARVRRARKIFNRLGVDGRNFLPTLRDEIRHVHIARDDSRNDFFGALLRKSLENFYRHGGRDADNFPVGTVHDCIAACRRQFRSTHGRNNFAAD